MQPSEETDRALDDAPDGHPLAQPSARQDPTTRTPVRRAQSIRRTSHIDIVFLDDGLLLDGAARDLFTGGGHPVALASGHVHARLDAERHLLGLTTIPEPPEVRQLLGLDVGAGFRGAVHRTLSEAAAATPLALLLDDLPVATLISGYARLYSGEMTSNDTDRGVLKADVCSGWRTEGTMMVALRERGALPVPVGPAAPVLESDDDPDAWHEMAPLAAGSMRRRRLVDIGGSDPFDIIAMFRDTHVGDDGDETVLHEYALRATVDAPTMVMTACQADPRVLPWTECPAAAASASDLVGHPVAEIRDLVRTDFRGTSTCTHLNDLLRSLGDILPLARLLNAAQRERTG